MARRRFVVSLSLLLASACSKDEDRTPCTTQIAPLGPPPTASSHALVEIDRVGRTVFAVSDVHGGFDRMRALFETNRVTDAGGRWIAGDAILVVAGDLVDKGPQPVEVIDALRALEASAPATGGEVVVLLGNHEAEFFADPSNDKASGPSGLDVELAHEGIDCGAVAAGAEPRGAWLRARPLGARVGGWFFSHAGNTKGRTFEDLDRDLRDALGSPSSFGHPEVIGLDSMLEARDWFADPTAASADARALGVTHFVFGHDPNALGPRGAIAVGQGGLLVRIDCGMSPVVNDSGGCLLRVRSEANEDVAEQLDALGRTTLLFRSPRP